MRTGGWNHNIHYHDVVLRSVPSECQRALDVGCGQGLLAPQLAQRSAEVIGIDVDEAVIARARIACRSEARIVLIAGDVMTHPFSDGSFDFIAAIATLHHLPLKPALERLRDLLRSGGVLAIVGMYHMATIEDYALAATALPLSWALRGVHRQADVGAPLQVPKETLSEIKFACTEVLPGAEFRRRLLFRYTLVWRKP